MTAPFTASPQPKAITPWSMKRIVTSTPITEPRAKPKPPSRSRRARRARWRRCRRGSARPPRRRPRAGAWPPGRRALELDERTPATPCGRRTAISTRARRTGASADRPRRDLTSEPPPGARLDEARQHDHAERPGDEHERQVDAVGGEEAVGLNAETKFARENDPEHSGGATDGCRRHPVKIPLRTAPRPSATRSPERLPSIRARRRYSHLVRGRARRSQGRARFVIRRPHLSRDGRRRVHGLAPDRGARPSRGGRDRVRARHLVRRAQQHRPPARAGSGSSSPT